MKALIKQVDTIRNIYKESERATASNYNIFKILGLETDEVRTHSSLIAALLDPKGTHGQDDTFLQLFLNTVLADIPYDIGEVKEVGVEKHCGFINEDATEGGRIDILIKDVNGNSIIIENKILAGDQENQLVRYKNYDPNATLLYLNLFGKDASPESKGDLVLNEDYFVISYETHIIKWLNECLTKSANLPFVRETINQYINLLNELTNQSANNPMTNKVRETILNDIESLKSAEQISKEYRKIKSNFVKQLSDTLKDCERTILRLDDTGDLVLKVATENTSGKSGIYYSIEINNGRRRVKHKDTNFDAKKLSELAAVAGIQFGDAGTIGILWNWVDELKCIEDIDDDVMFKLITDKEYFDSFVSPIKDRINTFTNAVQEIVNDYFVLESIK